MKESLQTLVGDVSISLLAGDLRGLFCGDFVGDPRASEGGSRFVHEAPEGAAVGGSRLPSSARLSPSTAKYKQIL